MSRRALCRWCIALAVFFAAYFALRTSLLTLESTLEVLANGNAAVSADALPGAWNPTRRFYGLTDTSRASVQTLFNVWPTEAQAASSSEP